MDKIKVRVNAKINLTLDVVGGFENNYHLLDMVMASIGIFDIVEVSLSDEIAVKMDMRDGDENNTAYKVAKICHDEYGIPPVQVNITKGIPFGGGLGGSSADASATLYCLQRMFNLTDKQVYDVACRVGSDVNFMLQGGLCRATGKGDNLLKLPFKEYSLVIAKGKTSANTKEVFAKFDEIGKSTQHTEKFVNNMACGNELEYIGNGLEVATRKLCVDMEKVICTLQKYSHYVCMSGSGSCVFAIMNDMTDANLVADSLKSVFPYVKACTTLPYGIKEFE